MISIIIPLYNEGGNVSSLLKSLSNLADKHEVILVDASDQLDSIKQVDALKEKTFEGLQIFTSEHPGRAIQMNMGASQATGDILLFLHCDTRLPSDALSLIDLAINENHVWGRFDINLDARGVVYRVIESMINLRSRLRQLATGDQGIFVRQEVFWRVKGFPEVAIMEDIALSRLLKSHSRPTLITKPLTTSARRWQNRGATATVLLMWKLRFLYWLGVPADRLSQMYGNER